MTDSLDQKSQDYIDSDYNTAKKYGSPTKEWVAAGPGPCDICLKNQEQGYIPINDRFSSGHEKPLAHEKCHCYFQAGLIDLNSIDIF